MSRPDFYSVRIGLRLISVAKLASRSNVCKKYTVYTHHVVYTDIDYQQVMFLLYTSEYTFSNGKNTLSAITTNKKKEQCDKKYHLKMLLPLGFKP